MRRRFPNDTGTNTGQGHFCGAQWCIWKPQERAEMTHAATMTPKERRARKMEMMAPLSCRLSSSFWYCRATRGCASTGEVGETNLISKSPPLPWLCTHSHLLTQQPQPLSPSSLPVCCPLSWSLSAFLHSSNSVSQALF